MRIRLQIIILCLCFAMADAQNTETIYLSGTGYGDTKTWNFFCSEGRNRGKWSKIEVPSQWELQGFGEYTFGRFYLKEGAKPSSETGTYRYDFKIPTSWKDKQVEIVFEGVMTDAEVMVNGSLAGDIHQGGFYSFSYDITDKLIVGKKNRLEVKVAKESANKSVNAAERRADWWLFGGIYRPVYLQAKPKTHIASMKVNAQMDGRLDLLLLAENIGGNYSLGLSLSPVGEGKACEANKTVKLEAGKDTIMVQTRFEEIKPWDCEHPNLYALTAELKDANGKTVHSTTERIGFRTIEFRPQDGFYCNGKRIIIKGVNRHCFHPNGGRTTNKALSISDAKLIKQMNMNAVRSHYSPDRHFLDACDSLGLFYLDEFTGWHGKYDTAIGEKLLGEFISHDMNHPCIFLWSNGNEGGWNKSLDSCFANLDLQQRHVIHPWADFNGVDAHHYPAYQTGTARLANGYKVFLPTEFLHSQYDKGAGAGLEDYWENYNRNPMFAGGFIWSFADEAVCRTDNNGILDSDGPNGPDGILGPNREKEGSFFTIREVWSPIQLSPFHVTSRFDGTILVTNRYLFSNLSECKMKYRLYSVSSPLCQVPVGKSLVGEGEVVLPPIEPGETGRASMSVPTNIQEADILELEAYDSYGESICTWTRPIRLARDYFFSQYGGSLNPADAASASIDARQDETSLSANGVIVSFSNVNGNILEVVSNGTKIPLTGGPLPVGMKASLNGISSRMEGNDAVVVVKYKGAIDSIEWRMKPNGLLAMRTVMLNRGNGGGYDGKFFDEKIYNLGLTFSYPEEDVKGMTWMGRGPYRVWKNRIPGTNYGLWQKDYNNTITGESYEQLVYPEFKGYHANVYWATLETLSHPFTVYSETDGVYLRVFTPEEPKNRRPGEDCMHEFPAGDISFLLDIPAMRSFKTISEHGPKSQPSTIRIKSGDDGLKLNLWFDFRTSDNNKQ